MQSKPCSCCKVEKPLFDFYKDSTKKLGVSSRCISCARAATKAWEQENRERKNKNSQAWVHENKEKRRLVMRKHHEKIGRDELARRLREWRTNNPEANRAALARRRSRKRNAGGEYTAGDIVKLFDLQQGKCTVCRCRLPKGYHVDHVQPLSKGGTNDPSNLQILCAPCNLTKNARDPVEFMQSRGFLC